MGRVQGKVKYELSREFLAELIPESMLKEAEKDAKKDQKETNDLQTIMDMITKGAGYWNSMADERIFKPFIPGKKCGQQIINIATTGNIPSSRSGKLPIKIMTAVKLALAAEEKLISEGITV